MEYTMEPFEETTNNEPMTVANQRMVGSKFENCDMAGNYFYRVHIKNSTFNGVNMSYCTFQDVTFGGSKITMSCVAETEIDGNVRGVVINGVPIKELFDAYEKVTGKHIDWYVFVRDQPNL